MSGYWLQWSSDDSLRQPSCWGSRRHNYEDVAAVLHLRLAAPRQYRTLTNNFCALIINQHVGRCEKDYTAVVDNAIPLCTHAQPLQPFSMFAGVNQSLYKWSGNCSIVKVFPYSWGEHRTRSRSMSSRSQHADNINQAAGCHYRDANALTFIGRLRRMCPDSKIAQKFSCACMKAPALSTSWLMIVLLLIFCFSSCVRLPISPYFELYSFPYPIFLCWSPYFHSC